ncbi:hypothetical protein JHD50_01400 [Sulfurimonas sp. MAG313]|nr:hypothetical protein [Sulfurimonas sp. MAG313]MDF1879964.1 hypothetical protein [Sulfurimonas sp. MAG313]
MKNILMSGLIVLSLNVGAQAEGLTKIGLGVGVAGSNSALIKLPLDIDDTFRIEPEFALSSVDFGNGSNDSFSIGSGFYLLNKTSEKTSVYYGGKFVFGDTNTGSSGSVLSAVGGFEYYLDTKVSLGAEVSFGIGFGSISGYSTNSSVNIRYYF